MKKQFTHHLWVLLLVLSYPVLGQSVSADSSWAGRALSSLRQQYAVGQRYSESRLYNGPEYVSHVPDYLTGHPFFGTAELQDATVEYDGTAYTVPLRFDLMRGLLVLSAPQGGLDLELVSEKVARFTLDGHTFVRVVVDSTSNSSVRTGFYELLLDGPVRVLAARKKSMQKRSVAEGMVGEITQKNTVFVCKNGRYYPANNAGQLLSLFSEQKMALRKYIKAGSLKFQPRHCEEDVVDLVRYQATLPSPGTRAQAQ